MRNGGYLLLNIDYLILEGKGEWPEGRGRETNMGWFAKAE